MRDGARHPINGILEDSGHRTVVFRRRNQEAVMLDHQLLQPSGRLWGAGSRFQILIEQGQREILQVDERDGGPSLPGALGRKAHELFVE